MFNIGYSILYAAQLHNSRSTVQYVLYVLYVLYVRGVEIQKIVHIHTGKPTSTSYKQQYLLFEKK